MSSAKYHVHAIVVCAHPMRRHQYTSIKGKRAGSKEERKGEEKREKDNRCISGCHEESWLVLDRQ